MSRCDCNPGHVHVDGGEKLQMAEKTSELGMGKCSGRKVFFTATCASEAWCCGTDTKDGIGEKVGRLKSE